MRRKSKFYFTLPEVVIAIAILGVGLLSILGVFPVAVKSGLQAVKISESIHKARAVATMWQNFPLKAPGGNPLPIKNDVYNFAFNDPKDNLFGVGGTTFVVTATDPIRTSVLNGKYKLDRISLSVGTDFVTKFYVLKPK